METVGKVIKSFKHELADIYPSTEIKSMLEIILEHFLGLSKTEMITKVDNLLNDNEIAAVGDVLKRLKNNEPLQYIIGETYFYDLRFNVAPGVLIPRQETEELVDWILTENKVKENLKVLDIGTGSGCIAIALSANMLMANVLAFDVSEEALGIARSNASLNNISVQFIKKDILKYLQFTENELFDLIVSNPPYVLEKEKTLMAKNVLDFEPELALFVKNDDPLLFYRAIADYANLNLKIDGQLYFEINEAYGKAVENLLTDKGFKNVELRKDLNGRDRMIRAIR